MIPKIMQIIPRWMKPIPTPIRGRLEEMTRCPYCNAWVYPETKICPKCGKNLIDPEVNTGQQKERGN